MRDSELLSIPNDAPQERLCVTVERRAPPPDLRSINPMRGVGRRVEAPKPRTEAVAPSSVILGQRGSDHLGSECPNACRHASHAEAHYLSGEDRAVIRADPRD